MITKLLLSVVLFCTVLFGSNGKSTFIEVDVNEDSLFIRNLFDSALLVGESYENLRFLCKGIGHRLTASPASYKAIKWAKGKVEELAADTSYLQDFNAPHWERGNHANLSYSSPGILREYLADAVALGGSVGTNGSLEAEVVSVSSFEELEAKQDEVKGKFVFYNKPMDKRLIDPFKAYGACAGHRFLGASEAARFGAMGVIVRTLTTEIDQHPHTGSMAYKEGVERIPAVAISTAHAEELYAAIQLQTTVVRLELDCKLFNDTLTHNVVAEITGTGEPDKVIVFGGHLDSWDLGEGAHDDGAGVVQSIEAFRLLLNSGYQPYFTLRLVLFMNEENGNRGGHSYAQFARENAEEHVVALETDRGGFSPRGFTVDGDSMQFDFVQQFHGLLKPYQLHYLEQGFAGVDIAPLKLDKDSMHPNMVQLGLFPDPQRYFNHHHAATDVFEAVNKRELELGSASMATMLYLMDKYYRP